jgi:phosphatidylinositol alpha-1,6-mannosyltransferase
MRVCLIANEFPPDIGGWQTYSYELASSLSEIDDVWVVAPEYDKEWEDPRGLRIRRFERHNLRSFVRNATREVKRIASEGLDVIHALMVHPAGYVGSRLRMPLVLTAHGNDFLFPDIFAKKMTKVALVKADSIVCVSNGTRSLLPPVHQGKATVVPNGTRPENFLTDKAGCKESLGLDRIILSVGRLVKRKGVDDILRTGPEVLGRFPDAKYVIVGDGPERKALETLSKDLGISSSVLFTGRVDDDTLRRYYSAADVFVMPSKFIGGTDVEGFGIVFLEANASLTPVIGRRSGGMEDAIEDGKSGFLIDDPSELAEKILYMLENETAAKQMAEYGRNRVLESFNWERIARRVHQVYEDVLRSR